MKGVYVLIIKISQPCTISIRSLGKLILQRGIWVYVGSAMGKGSTSLEKRILRHFRTEKKIHWHIDHLLACTSKIQSVVWIESTQSLECKIAQLIECDENFISGPRGFGASDCRNRCSSHLFFSNRSNKVGESIRDLLISEQYNPRISYDGILEST